MAEIATLGLKVDGTANIDGATQSLDRFSQSGRTAEQSTGTLSRESQKSSKSLADVARESDRASGGVNRLAQAARRATGILTAFLGARQIVNYADTWTNLTSRIELSIAAHEDAADVMSRLSDISRQTFSTFESTAEAFAQNSVTLRALGKSTQEQLNYTEALNNAIAVSGAEGATAQMVQDNLSRAMAEGALRSEELNSVLNYGSRVAELLADELGVNVTQLRALAAEGEITGGVIFNALTGNMEKLAAESAGMGSTVRGAMRVLSNSVLEAVGVLNQQSEAGARASRVILGLADAIGDIDFRPIISAANALVLVIGARLVSSLAAASASFIAGSISALRYQVALASMAGVSATAAIGQTALAVAARGASAALLLVGGPVGAAIIAAGSIYYFRDALGLTRTAIGLTEQELADLRKEMAEMDGAEITQTLSQVENSLMQVGLKAAAAREELAKLRSENRGSGSLGFGGGELGKEIRGMQAVAEYTAQMTELEQRRSALVQESNTRAYKPLSEWLFTVADASEEATDKTEETTKALRASASEADQFSHSLQSLVDALFPVEAAQREYTEQQGLLTRAWNEGTITAERYTEAMQRLERAQLSAQTAAGAYGGGGGFGSEIGSRGEVGSPTDPLAGNDTQGAWDEWLQSAENAFSDFETLNASLAENFTSNFGGMFADVLLEQSSFRDAFQQTMEGIARSVISAIGEMIAQWLAYQAVTAAVGAFGGGGGGFASLLPFANGGLVPSYASGGYTGSGGKYDPAGIVHAGEFVVRKEMVEQPGMRSLLEGINSGSRSSVRSDRLNIPARHNQQGTPVAPVINITTPSGTTAQTDSRQDQDGKWVVDVLVANIQQGGKADKAIRSNYGLSRQGV